MQRDLTSSDQPGLPPAEAELARVRQDVQVIKADIRQALDTVSAARTARLRQLAQSRAP